MKRSVAIFCALTLCISLFAAIAINASATGNPIKVGFAQEDINPYARHYLAEGETGIGTAYTDEEDKPYYYWWKDTDGNLCHELMPLPLRGSGKPLERICANSLIDDNGDGVVDENDGLYTTTIAITQDGREPILLVSLDLNYTFARAVRDVKAAIVEATNGAVSADHIMVTCTSTQGSIDISSYHEDIITPDTDEEEGSGDIIEDTSPDDSNTGEDGTGDIEVDTHATYDLHSADGTVIGTINGQDLYNNIATWYERFVDQVALSAVNALADCEAATMTKGYIDASEASVTEDTPNGLAFNAMRHIARVDEDGKLFVSTDNVATPANTESAYLTDAYDTMSLLQFSFETEGKAPIVLVNWNATPNLNTRNSTETYYSVNGDYINCFRRVLGDYRVGFFQGITSNIHTTSRITSDTSWMLSGIGDKNEAGICTGLELAGNVYGTALAAVAEKCLTDDTLMVTADTGNIGFVDMTYNATRKSISDEIAYWAATTALTYYNNLTDKSDEIYRPSFVYPTAVAGIEGLTDAMTAEELEKYNYFLENQATTGTYVIGSTYHANDIISNYLDSYTTEIPITAFNLGEDIAFVTIPGELSDCYYNETVTWDALKAEFDACEGTDAEKLQAALDYISAQKNLWDYVNETVYGSPFVLSMCNGSNGDLSNAISFDYNKGSATLPQGCYESHVTEIAKGSGEKVMEIYRNLLNYLIDETGNDYAISAYCQHCDKEVTWRELSQEFNDTVYMEGHYYLTSDLSCPQKQLKNSQSVCIDLNGHTMTGWTRAFYAYNGSTVTIMDNTETKAGVVQGYGGGVGVGYYGGALYTEEEGTINLYSGTVTQIIQEDREVARGGVVSSRGTFNMYGGTITGGKAATYGGNIYVNYTKMDDGNGGYIYKGSEFNLYDGNIIGGSGSSGGNIFVQSGCTLNVEGGNITGGTSNSNSGGTIYANGSNTIVTDGDTVVRISGGTIGGGDARDGATLFAAVNTNLELLGGTVNAGANNTKSCIYTRGSVLLKGDTDVARLNMSSTAELTIEGAYTGTTQLRFADDLTPGYIIGSSIDADISDAALTIYGDEYVPLVYGENVIASFVCNPSIVDSEGNATAYNTLDYALLAYQGTEKTIVLNEDSQAAITYDGDIEIDLNGCNLSGEYAMSSGNVHYIDSETTDYNVEDDNYGRITGANAALIDTQDGVVLTDDGYLMVSEDDGISFHKIDTGIQGLYFRPEKAGIYYGATFKGDQIVNKYVNTFGVAVSIQELPVMDANGNFADHTMYSAFTGANVFTPGDESEYTSTILINIIDEEYGTIVNKRNGSTDVYARSYIKLTDGTCIYSPGCCHSLKWVVEYTDAILWNTDYMTDARKAAILELYERFPAVFNAWDIPNIKEAA